MPARADVNDGVVLIIHNFSTAGENLTVKNSATTTLAVIPSSGIALVFAAVADETPGTREWKVALVGGEDLALADDLTVTGDLNVTGPSTFTGSILASAGGKISSATSVGIAFYGTTTVSQRASSAQASSLVTSTSLGTAGAAVLLEVVNTLTALGLWKGAA